MSRFPLPSAAIALHLTIATANAEPQRLVELRRIDDRPNEVVCSVAFSPDAACHCAGNSGSHEQR